MLIGELAEKTNLSRDTIRYYETRGLLPGTSRRDNRYKDYPDDAVQRLSFIRDMQELGFTLRETGELIELSDSGNATCRNTGPHIQKHVQSIDEKIEKLTVMRMQMQKTFTACSGNTLDDPCTPIAETLTNHEDK